MVKSEPVTPLDRPKAIESLGGLVEPEPLPRLLIGIMPRFHLGTWLTWTIATPLGSLVVSDHGNTIWSAQISLFCKRFCHCLCFTLFFERYFVLFIAFFKPTKFSTGSHCQLTEHGPFLIRRLFAQFTTRHGLHGKPALYIYRSCYLLQTVWIYKPLL